MLVRIITIASCFLVSSCAFFFDDTASPGRIMRGNLDEGISKIEKACKGMGVNSCSVEELEVIGHGAGSYRYYPKNIHKSEYAYGNKWSNDCKSEAKDVSVLIDNFFKNDRVSSVEIDVQG